METFLSLHTDFSGSYLSSNIEFGVGFLESGFPITAKAYVVSAESHVFELLDFAGSGLRSSTHKNLSLYSLLAALPFIKVVSGLERGLSEKEH